MSDPLADMQNILGYQGLVGPNPYLQYQGAIPMAGYNTRSPFTGPVVMGPQDQLPTDANGNPIQPPYGTTLNSPPPAAASAAAPQTNNGQQWAAQNSMLLQEKANLQNQQGGPNQADMENIQLQQIRNNQQYGGPYYDQARLQAIQNSGGNITLGQLGQVQPNWVQGNMPIQMPGGGTLGGLMPQQQQFNAQQAAQAPAAAASPQTGLNRDQYLALLANPGKVPTYGAAGPQPGQMQTGAAQQPSVIGSFLAAHPGGGTTGAGGYNNTGFFNTLRQLQGSTA